MGINLGLIKLINNYIIKNFKFDVTFLSIVNKENMKKRLKLRNKKNKYDFFKYSFYKRVQNGFLKISNKKNKYIILDSNIMNINETKNFLIKKINTLIASK